MKPTIEINEENFEIEVFEIDSSTAVSFELQNH